MIIPWYLGPPGLRTDHCPMLQTPYHVLPTCSTIDPMYSKHARLEAVLSPGPGSKGMWGKRIDPLKTAGE